MGKERSVSDAKEFDSRGFSNRRDFNCVGPPRPLPCYTEPRKSYPARRQSK